MLQIVLALVALGVAGWVVSVFLQDLRAGVHHDAHEHNDHDDHDDHGHTGSTQPQHS